MVPEVWELILLGLAAGRLWKVIGDDRILDRPRDWALAKLGSDDQEAYWGDFLVCPWCAGFWISLVLWTAWLIWPYGTLVFCGLWAISALVGLFGVTVDKLTS